LCCLWRFHVIFHTLTFFCQGDDLHLKLHIPLIQALLGVETSFEHLDKRRIPVKKTGVTRPEEVSNANMCFWPVPVCMCVYVCVCVSLLSPSCRAKTSPFPLFLGHVSDHDDCGWRHAQVWK
jgi:hypothetical protein